jgi:hypothetical protein
MELKTLAEIKKQEDKLVVELAMLSQQMDALEAEQRKPKKAKK